MTASQNLTDACDPMAGTLAGSYARAGDMPDPWAHPGAETFRATPEARINAGFDPGAGAGPAPALNVNILALDLGTKLGWAVRARSFVTDLVVRHQVHAIAYEDVKRHAGTDAAHAYGAFLCLVQMVADSHRAALMPVGVGTIKKHWTGKGNADKAAVEAQARARGFRPESDNDADALAILHWAVEQEKAA